MRRSAFPLRLAAAVCLLCACVWISLSATAGHGGRSAAGALRWPKEAHGSPLVVICAGAHGAGGALACDAADWLLRPQGVGGAQRLQLSANNASAALSRAHRRGESAVVVAEASSAGALGAALRGLGVASPRGARAVVLLAHRDWRGVACRGAGIAAFDAGAERRESEDTVSSFDMRLGRTMRAQCSAYAGVHSAGDGVEVLDFSLESCLRVPSAWAECLLAPLTSALGIKSSAQGVPGGVKALLGASLSRVQEEEDVRSAPLVRLGLQNDLSSEMAYEGERPLASELCHLFSSDEFLSSTLHEWASGGGRHQSRLCKAERHDGARMRALELAITDDSCNFGTGQRLGADLRHFQGHRSGEGGDEVILVPVGGGASYLSFAMNLAESFRRSGVRSQIIFVSLDAKTHAFMCHVGAPSLHLFKGDRETQLGPAGNQGFQTVTTKKLRAVHLFLSSGYNVTLLDSDVVMAQDPSSYLRNFDAIGMLQNDIGTNLDFADCKDCCARPEGRGSPTIAPLSTSANTPRDCIGLCMGNARCGAITVNRDTNTCKLFARGADTRAAVSDAADEAMFFKEAEEPWDAEARHDASSCDVSPVSWNTGVYRVTPKRDIIRLFSWAIAVCELGRKRALGDQTCFNDVAMMLRMRGGAKPLQRRLEALPRLAFRSGCDQKSDGDPSNIMLFHAACSLSVEHKYTTMRDLGLWYLNDAHDRDLRVVMGEPKQRSLSAFLDTIAASRS